MATLEINFLFVARVLFIYTYLKSGSQEFGYYYICKIFVSNDFFFLTIIRQLKRKFSF